MMKRIVIMTALLFGLNAQAEQQELPPPKIIGQDETVQTEQPASEQQSSDQQPQEQGQQVLPPPKVIDQPARPARQGKLLYKLFPIGDGVWVMIDPDKGRHPCVADSKRDIVCRW